MDQAPQPPHERTWRHPSELGPTKFDVDLGGRSHVGVLVAGACAVLVVAALVVVATPRPGSGPLAISATTTPFVRGVAATEVVRTPSPAQPTVGKLLGSYTAYPHAIAATSLAALDGADVAEEPPSGSVDVLVRTDKVTYQLKWSQVPLLAAPEGTIVFDLQGDVIARVIGGELRMLVDG